MSHGLAFRLRRRSRAALRRNARPYAFAGGALRSPLTLPRFPVLLPGFAEQPSVHLLMVMIGYRYGRNYNQLGGPFASRTDRSRRAAAMLSGSGRPSTTAGIPKHRDLCARSSRWMRAARLSVGIGRRTFPLIVPSILTVAASTAASIVSAANPCLAGAVAWAGFRAQATLQARCRQAAAAVAGPAQLPPGDYHAWRQYGPHISRSSVGSGSPGRY